MNKLYVIGIGSCNINDMTIRAISLLEESDFIFSDEKSGKLISKFFNGNNFVLNNYNQTKKRCETAIKKAQSGYKVSIIGTGDTGIYGIAGIILNLIGKNSNIDVEIVCGITSAISGASLLGAPLEQDFAVISLSENISSPDVIIKRVSAAARADFSMVFYSPCNNTNRNINRVKQLLLGLINGFTPVGIVKNIGREGEETIITNLKNMEIGIIDIFTIIFIGNSKTYVKNGKMISPIV